MNLDLNELLQDWPHEPGQIKVRKIVGNDGREKLQLRIDLGILQMEMDGRPDGVRPHECESYLEFYKKQANEAAERGERYLLTADQCAELQQEGIQYYHRYISLFQMDDFVHVVRDTQRNLELFDFVTQHVEQEDVSWAFEQFRPYVLMMNTRAKASLALEEHNIPGAVKFVQEGMRAIDDFYQNMNTPEMASESPELQFLQTWLDEIRSSKPLSKLDSMRREMDEAIAREAYERAAELRDAIRKMTKSDSPGS